MAPKAISRQVSPSQVNRATSSISWPRTRLGQSDTRFSPKGERPLVALNPIPQYQGNQADRRKLLDEPLNPTYER